MARSRQKNEIQRLTQNEMENEANPILMPSRQTVGWQDFASNEDINLIHETNKQIETLTHSAPETLLKADQLPSEGKVGKSGSRVSWEDFASEEDLELIEETNEKIREFTA